MGPLHVSGMGVARDFKFGVLIDRQADKLKNAKVGQKGSGLHRATYFYHFGTTFIFLEWTELETLVFGVFVGLQVKKMQKYVKMGVAYVT